MDPPVSMGILLIEARVLNGNLGVHFQGLGENYSLPLSMFLFSLAIDFYLYQTNTWQCEMFMFNAVKCDSSAVCI